MLSTELDRLLSQMQFPGMPQLESSYTRAWLRRFGLEYDRFEFNVRLGKGRNPIEGLMPEIQLQNELLSKLRADIVGFRGSLVDIIEVKDRARFNALGQLKGYAALWREEHPESEIRNLIVVARTIDPDAQTAYAAEGIVYSLVEPEGYQ